MIIRFFSYFVICFGALSACQKKAVVSGEKPNEVRVLGYLLGANNWSQMTGDIDLSKITDLNIAFINPDSAGRFTVESGLATLVEKASQNKVRVYMSIGGGSAPAYLQSLISPAKRGAYIDSLLSICERFNFRGIDVDLENELINADYPGFVSALGKELKTRNKEMTAALAKWNGHKIPDSTLSQYDLINIMSYDATGPWSPSRPGPHSPYEMVEADFYYYHRDRKVPANKLMIGLPFYGYSFGNLPPSSMRYREIISSYPGAELLDEQLLNNGNTVYYNGLPTIRKKVEFAINNHAAGLMIWELKQDSRDEKSLLRMIHSLLPPS